MLAILILKEIMQQRVTASPRTTNSYRLGGRWPKLDFREAFVCVVIIGRSQPIGQCLPFNQPGIAGSFNNLVACPPGISQPNMLPNLFFGWRRKDSAVFHRLLA